MRIKVVIRNFSICLSVSFAINIICLYHSCFVRQLITFPQFYHPPRIICNVQTNYLLLAEGKLDLVFFHWDCNGVFIYRESLWNINNKKVMKIYQMKMEYQHAKRKTKLSCIEKLILFHNPMHLCQFAEY